VGEQTPDPAAVDTYTSSLAHNDRAILEGEDAQRGFVKVRAAAPLAFSTAALLHRGASARLHLVHVLHSPPQVHCRKGTDQIVGGTVVAARAGEIVNELTLAMQAGVGLGAVARVIHPYPTTAEGVMQAGLGFIRANWAKLPAR
jgi:pyruvate/2-oxoglutarate dehydrogenase complex dihydrolipoamide dehydrogenase (E3) component